MSKKLGLFIVKSEGTGEEVKKLMPLLDIAATLISDGKRILTVYNSKWGAFTLPMSKRKSWEQRTKTGTSERIEDWEDTAVRAAVEWLGRTVTVTPAFLAELSEFQQSDRDGDWKRYCVRAYKLAADQASVATDSSLSEWLTPGEILDEKRRPISPTARHIIAELQMKSLV